LGSAQSIDHLAPGKSGRSVKPTVGFHLVLMLRISGTILHFPFTAPCFAQDNVTNITVIDGLKGIFNMKTTTWSYCVT